MTKQDLNKSTSDISESASDKAHLQPDTGYIDLPEVKDIPGQENIRPAPLGELADITISSDDEEGKGIFMEDDEDGEDNVTEEERDLLDEAAESMGSEDDTAIQNARVDLVDLDGDLLNEEDDLKGNDLDVPGSEEDDADEETGNEDEENNEYSLGGENHDN